MGNRFRPGKIIVILFLSLLTTALLFRDRDYTQTTLNLDTSISNLIKENGLSDDNLLYEKQERFRSGRYRFLKIEKHYEIGTGFEADSFLASTKRLLRGSRFKLAKSVFEKREREEDFLISLSFKNRILYVIKFLKRRYTSFPRFQSANAKIAIVLDDFGYNMNNIETLFKLGTPLTISILPNLPYSKRIAEQAYKRDFEVMLHLPLEPYGEEPRLEEGTIMVDMPPQKVNELLVKAIESVPGLKGVSNHMGSKATEDHDFMKGLFGELKNRGLYFLDNLVTDKSVCSEVAQEAGLRIVTRSVFLDNKSNESYIERQIFRTAQLATKSGWAIGVGHDRSRTIKVLTKVIPQLEKAGYEFVFISELVQ